MKSRLYGPGLHQSFPVCMTPLSGSHLMRLLISMSDPA
jgi:hypothetical protein